MQGYEGLIKPEEAVTSFTERHLARRKLKNIVRKLLEIPEGALPAPEHSIDEYNECLQVRDFQRIAYVALRDGVALHYTTRGWLENRSNRFVFPKEGEPSYHREPYHVDCQSLGSARLDVSGVDNLVADRNVTNQIEFVNWEVIQSSMRNWAGFEVEATRAQRC